MYLHALLPGSFLCKQAEWEEDGEDGVHLGHRNPDEAKYSKAEEGIEVFFFQFRTLKPTSQTDVTIFTSLGPPSLHS